MLRIANVILLIHAVFSAAAPADPILGKFSEGLRYDYLESDAGDIQLVDNWMKLSDYNNLARYNPLESNKYFLFTRDNPEEPQELLIENEASVLNSSYDSKKYTVVLMHGFAGSARSLFNTLLTPAFLEADDCNVIVLDWSAGSSWGPRARQAAEAGAVFVNWLMEVTGSKAEQFTIVGFSVGGHGAGILGRNMEGSPRYIISCDPSSRWNLAHVFRSTDGNYTEVIHTNTGYSGMKDPLGDVDFYPNTGNRMPGCLTALCDHDRSFQYLAESLTTAGFLGSRCLTLDHALSGECELAETLNMGGAHPKPGRSGIFFLRTRATRPFSL